VGVLATLGDGSWAASVLDFDIWMGKLDKRTQAVHRSLSRRDAEAAVSEARQIEEIYRLIEDYFVKEGDKADAVRLSQQGRASAGEIVRSVGRRDFEAAFVAALSITQACDTCHDAYKPLE